MVTSTLERTGRRFRVANSETARDINRRILLNLIRARQPISRADLARCSGMQPSTVSLITEELISEKWLEEGPLGHLPRGRKPRFLRLNSGRAGILGIDLRGSGTRIGIADLNAQFRVQESFATAPRLEDFIKDVCRRARALIESHPEIAFEGIGMSVPGRVDLETHRLSFSAKLGWRNVDFKTPLERATGLPVELENAANACALAEIWFGSHAPGERDLAVVTVSDGIGAGIVIDGHLVRGRAGLAGEFGHVTIAHDGPACRCGNRGCWELFASNSAAIRYYRELCAGSRRRNSIAEDTAPRFDDLLALAQQGDSSAGKAIDRVAYFLGVGMASLVTTLTPQVILLAGEITRAWARLEPILRQTIAERSLERTAPRLVALEDNLHPRLRGTVALVMQKHFALPAGFDAGRAVKAVRREAVAP
jgi:predicted NBD/HSP70 family sugar kinase